MLHVAPIVAWTLDLFAMVIRVAYLLRERKSCHFLGKYIYRKDDMLCIFVNNPFTLILRTLDHSQSTIATARPYLTHHQRHLLNYSKLNAAQQQQSTTAAPAQSSPSTLSSSSNAPPPPTSSSESTITSPTPAAGQSNPPSNSIPSSSSSTLPSPLLLENLTALTTIPSLLILLLHRNTRKTLIYLASLLKLVRLNMSKILAT